VIKMIRYREAARRQLREEGIIPESYGINNGLSGSEIRAMIKRRAKRIRNKQICHAVGEANVLYYGFPSSGRRIGNN